MIPASRTDNEQTNIWCSSVSYLAVMLRHKWAPVGEEEIYYSSSLSRSHRWKHGDESWTDNRDTTAADTHDDRQDRQSYTVVIVMNVLKEQCVVLEKKLKTWIFNIYNINVVITVNFSPQVSKQAVLRGK